MSTFIHTSAAIFFAFVLLNGVAQAALGSYLQTSCIAIASLFGPTAVQPMMSGQAAVAVAVSGVQVLSAIASTWNEQVDANGVPTGGHGEAAERSAFVFFLLSTLFLLVSAGCMAWLVSMPAYKAVAGALEKPVKFEDDEETTGLVSRGHHEPSSSNLHIFKTNIVYHIAVAYVFVVTLVRVLLVSGTVF